MNAHHDKIALSSDSTGESTPAIGDDDPSIIRHAGCCRDVAVARRSRCAQDRVTRLRRPRRRERPNRRRSLVQSATREVSSIHSRFSGSCLGTTAVLSSALGRWLWTRCAYPPRAAILDSLSGSMADYENSANGQTHASSARVSLIALSRGTVRRVSRTFARSRSMRAADPQRDAADGLTSRRLTS